MKTIAFVLFIATSALNCGATEPPPPGTLVDPGAPEYRAFEAPPLVPGALPVPADKFLVGSDLYAGCLIGFQALQAHWKDSGVELTPHELTLRHREIGCRRIESGLIMVTFFPATLQVGGGITYYVDPEQLRVVRTVYGR